MRPQIPQGTVVFGLDLGTYHCGKLRPFRPFSILGSYFVRMELPLTATTMHTYGPKDWCVCDLICPSLVPLASLAILLKERGSSVSTPGADCSGG
jgi:hypothetical protein